MSKGAILSLVGVIIFVACCNHVITRNMKGFTHNLVLQRNLEGTRESLWTFSFGGIIAKVDESNEQELEPQTNMFTTLNASNEQQESIELKPQTEFTAITTSNEQQESIELKPQTTTLMSVTTSNEQAESIELGLQTNVFTAMTASNEQAESIELGPLTNVFTAITTSNEREESLELEFQANTLVETTTNDEQEETIESKPESKPRCFLPASPPPLPGKKGIGMTLREVGREGSWEENLPKVIALDPYWNYSWGPKRIAMQPDNIEFIPMLWGALGSEGLERRIATDIMPQIQSGQAKRLLGFNEPGMEKQSDLTVDEVISYWPILERTDIPLASPSVGRATGSWMVKFMQETEEKCRRMEYIAVHMYGPPSAGSFKNKMREAYELYGSWRPMLITEFAVVDWNANTVEENRYSAAQALTFMKEVLPWMQEPEQDWIAGYSWFSFKSSSPAGTSSALFDENGNITTLGRYYASVNTENPNGDQSIEIEAP
jgi:hypothetical protein